MKANKKVMAALLAAMMSVSAGAAVVSAGIPVAGVGSEIGSNLNTGWRATVLNGKYYYSYEVSQGQYATGWKLIDGAWYFFAQHDAGTPIGTDAQATGTSTNEWYFALTDTRAICSDSMGGHIYRFGKDGKMVTGWYQVSNTPDPVTGIANGWEYYNSNGINLTGWFKVGANWFYIAPRDMQVEFKENSYWVPHTIKEGTLLMNGTFKFDNQDGQGVKVYTFNHNGVLQNEGQGWVQDRGNWYYMKRAEANGSLERKTGERSKLNGQKLLASSWELINGKYYAFDTDGKMLTGWQEFCGLDENGKEQSSVESRWYYMTGNGDCVLNSWVQMADGTWYLTNASGEMVTGWAVRGGKTYYLNELNANGNGTVISGRPYGVMATGTVYIKGYKCTFDASGALVSINDQVVSPGTIPSLPNA